MEANTTDSEVFQVGLCMAGAVSAGAYTAGVMDYLIEALAEWESRRGQPGVPSHRVEIPVLGGASAGGMTSIITASALAGEIIPVSAPSEDLLAEHPENRFYNAWVDLAGDDMFSKMLDTGDLQGGNVLSILNSSFIEGIAHKMVSQSLQGGSRRLPFFSDRLKIFTTLSNLSGFGYSADFNSASTENSKYRMRVHNDFACFQLQSDTSSLCERGWIPLDFNSGLNLDIARDAAMATGAFPVGLQSRIVRRESSFVNNNPFLQDVMTNSPVEEGIYESLTVDGGLINNEPFDRVREILLAQGAEAGASIQSHNSFSSTVLMIEPFPTKKPGIQKKDRSILNVMGLTLSAMITQMRAKPLQIASALDKNCAGQYLITPSRHISTEDDSKTELTGELAIACGALSGFSGFISKEFRVHDYFLGRYNCQIFLRDYFTIPVSALSENPIFSKGYAGSDPSRFRSEKDGSVQIIPIFAPAGSFEFPMFKFKSGTDWPSLQQGDLERFKPAVRRRIHAVLMNLVKLNLLERVLLWIGSKVLLSRSLSKTVMRTLRKELLLWKLIDLPEDFHA